MTKSKKYILKTGFALMLGSAFLFSTAGIFTKGVSAVAWQVIFWRAFFSAIMATGAIAARGRLGAEYLRMGWRGGLSALIGAAGTAMFLSAFKHTSVANVALIYSTTPVMAALLAWGFLREAPGRNVIIGALLGIVGIAVIVSGTPGKAHLLGDLLAFGMSVALALLFVLYRAWPGTPSAGPVALSSVLLLPVSGMMANPFAVPGGEIAILAAFGLVFALASYWMLEGAKRLPSGQTALLSTTETPFAIILAWAILSEVPVMATLIGGGVLLVGVVIGSLGKPRHPGNDPSNT
jgi:drug/metabolite transporter (DMT)-like permease